MAISNREISFIVKMRNEARAKMREVGGDFRQMARDAREATTKARQGLDQLGDGADRARGRLGGLSTAIRGIGLAALATAAIAAGRALVNAGETYTNFSNRLTSIGIAAEDVGPKLRELREIAASSSSDLDSTVSLYARASVALGELGASSDETSRFVTTWQRAMAVGGATAQEAASATLQFSQALGSGVLRGEEFNAVNEASPYLMRELAQAMGVPVGSLRQLAQEGRITSEVLRTAMANMAASVDEDFGRMKRTATQAWQGFTDQVSLSLGEAMSAIGGSEGLASVIDGATAAVRYMADYVGVVGPAVGEVFTEIGLTLKPVIDGIGDWISGLEDAGGETISLGDRFTATMLFITRNTAAGIRWLRENWGALGDWIGRLWTDIGNAIMRPVAEAFMRIEALSAAMIATTQGNLEEAGRLSARAFGNAITEEVRRLYPEIQTAFRQATEFEGVTWNEARRTAQARASSTSTSSTGGVPGSPVAPGGGEGAGADAAQATRETTEAVADQNTRISENISLWDAVRVAAGNAMGEIKNRGELMVEGIQTAFDHAGRAFQQFVTTGELNFKQLIATILQEIAAMMAAEAWKNFMATMAGTSGGSTGSTGGSSGNFWADAAMFVAGFFHDGGIVGDQVRAARSINPAVFAQAKRYHSGGYAGLASGEVPIIAKRGEAVMPTVRLPNGDLGVQATGSGGGNVTHNQFSVSVTVNGAGKDGQEIGEEVAAATLEKLEKFTRATTRDEIIKAQRAGGINSWRP